MLELPEGHKLDDVPHGRLARGRAQQAVVPVQELHGAEVGPAHADDDDGHGEAGGVNDGAARLVHVRDHAVGDDEQHKVLLWSQEDRRLGKCLKSKSKISSLVLESFVEVIDMQHLGHNRDMVK